MAPNIMIACAKTLPIIKIICAFLSANEQIYEETSVSVHVHGGVDDLESVDILNSSPGVMRYWPDPSGSNRPRSRYERKGGSGR